MTPEREKELFTYLLTHLTISLDSHYHEVGDSQTQHIEIKIYLKEPETGETICIARAQEPIL